MPDSLPARLAWWVYTNSSAPGLIRTMLMLNRRRFATWAASDPPPTLERVASQAPTRAQFDSGIYKYWCEQMREPPRYHRKQWEFVYILEALRKTNMIGASRRGVGFGVGQEPLPAVLAAHGCHVLATDLEPNAAAAAAWQNIGQHAASKAMLNDRGICPSDRFDQLVAFCCVDMNDLRSLDAGTFDFVWSACALEHTGSLGSGIDFILSSIDLLKPGGVAVHTTELNVSSDRHTVSRGSTVLYRKRDLDGLAAMLRAKGCELHLNFHIDWHDKVGSYVDVPPYDGGVHLRLLLGLFISTSYGLLIRKKLG